MIYVIGEADDRSTPVKIGVTVDIQNRFKSYQLHTWRRVELLAALPGDKRVERAIHVRFRASQYRGEWFRRTQEIVDFIAENPPTEELLLAERNNPDLAPRSSLDQWGRHLIVVGEQRLCGMKGRNDHVDVTAFLADVSRCRFCSMRYDEHLAEEEKRRQREADAVRPVTRPCTVHTGRFVVFAEGTDEHSARRAAHDWVLKNRGDRDEAAAALNPRRSRLIWKAGA